MRIVPTHLVVAAIAAGVALLGTGIVNAERTGVPATVLEKSQQEAHTAAGVLRWNESSGKVSTRYYRAQLRSYPDRFWIKVHRKRFMAPDTYEFQVDRATYEAATVGKVIARPHGHRADFKLLAWGASHKGGAAYAWEPAWDDAEDLAREHDADIQRTQVWMGTSSTG